MTRLNAETLSIRPTSQIKDLLRQAALLEHRSVASMIELLVLRHAEQNQLHSEASKSVGTTKPAVRP